MKDTVFSEREASSAEFNEREASSILRGSGLAGDELHRRRDRGAVVGRVARGEVSTQHRDGLRHVNLIRRPRHVPAARDCDPYHGQSGDQAANH